MPQTAFLASFRDLSMDGGRRARAHLSLADEQEVLVSIATLEGVNPYELMDAVRARFAKEISISTAYRMIGRHGYRSRRRRKAV